MSNNKMLIDATHPEETRVVVLRGGRVEEFDFESAARKPLRGNIYLAKVTRVEPSLQAAFVDYGGNRHGFLAFNEIHPDYYQIPVADRQALLDEEAAAEAEEEAAADARAERMARRGRGRRRGGRDRDGGRGGARSAERGGGDQDAESATDGDIEGVPPSAAAAAAAAAIAAMGPPSDEEPHLTRASDAGLADERLSEAVADSDDDDDLDDLDNGDDGDDAAEIDDAPHPIGLVEADGVEDIDDDAEGDSDGEPAAEDVEQVASEEDALEELPSRPRRRPRSYKIQEVIKRRQVILVQVVKEERGNKGAALTTYLSLAGRYTVLMPNTARGGGISRKITNPQDRKRLKAIAQDLDVPEGMGLIIRTAGAARTQQEIKRDFEYLLRLWENVRDMTLQSTAPSLVYEEGDLIKRSIRDHYTKDVDEVLVAGEHAYTEARDFMRMLMPSHAKNVIDYREPEPLFNRFQIERQLNAMFSPFVTLKSGGYLVINQTEALVAIDINSGKSTREFSIEETALNTNLEAADEIARQLKLRDLAGLIVIDFIDMEEKRNNRAVERRIKDALRFDRARIQVGRISHFGLLEMSRQRLRTGVLEGSTSQCPHCQGTGIVRSTESVALAVLRSMEDALINSSRNGVIAMTPVAVALYILNNKRAFIIDMERRYSVPILVQASDKMHGANFSIERTAAPAQSQRRPERAAVSMDWGFDDEDAIEDAPERAELVAETVDDDDVGEESEARHADNGNGEAGGDGGRRRRRRRRRGGRRGEAGEADRGDHDDVRGDIADTDGDDEVASFGAEADNDDDGEESAKAGFADADGERDGGERGARRSRRRGRRGGRRGRERRDGETAADAASETGEGMPIDLASAPQPDVEFPFPTASYAASEGTNGSSSGSGRAPRGEGGGRRRGRDRWAGGRRDEQRDQDRSARDTDSPGAAAVAAAIAAASFAAVEPEPAAEASVAVHREARDTPTAAHESPGLEVAAAEVVTFSVAAETVATAPAREEPAPRRRTVDTSPVEPKLERVVVRPSQASEAEAQSEAEPVDSTPKPTRRGWWQRRLLGEN